MTDEAPITLEEALLALDIQRKQIEALTADKRILLDRWVSAGFARRALVRKTPGAEMAMPGVTE